MTLYVVSPNHGKSEYHWKRKSVFSQDWTLINVPAWTCLLRVNESGNYRCSFDDMSISFEVKHATRKKCEGENKCTELVYIVAETTCEWSSFVTYNIAILCGKYTCTAIVHVIDLHVPITEVEVQEEIGRGCFSVHKGKWKGTTVALKKIPIPSGVSEEEVLVGNKEIAALRFVCVSYIL